MNKIYFLVAVIVLSSCSDLFLDKRPSMKEKSLGSVQSEIFHKTYDVIATAYTSSVRETNSRPFLSACGNRLRPGMNVIAVSRDLEKRGFVCGTKVKILELGQVYTVMDRMNSRWRNKIDIYMGVSRKKAIQWGKKKVRMRKVE